MEHYVAAAGKTSRILEQDQRSWFLTYHISVYHFYFQGEFEEQYDIVQKIGEGWYSRVYLTEHRSTHHELVLKAVNNKNMSVEEFLREFHHSLMLGAHQNILTVFPDMVFSLESQCCMFASEYAPLGKTITISKFWEGHKILQNLYLTFDWQYTGQK